MKKMYSGLFLTKESEELLRKRGKMLIKKVKNLHVTFHFGAFEPFPENMLNKVFTCKVIGEGKNKKNHGYLVELPSELNEFHNVTKKKCITVSLGSGGKSMYTSELDFKPIQPFTIEGTLGYYTNEGTVVFENTLS